MCIYPEIKKIIEYSNGSSISISGIHPFSYQTREIENKEIHVIFSLMEELKKPDFLRTSIDENLYPWLYHYYYRIKNEPGEMIENLFESISRQITRFLDRRMNVLIHCRTGISVSVSILISFFIRSTIFSPHYLFYNYDYFIPKTTLRWSDSFLEFIRLEHPEAAPIGDFMEKLYIYENNLIQNNFY